jgi:hypothetical protein
MTMVEMFVKRQQEIVQRYICAKDKNRPELMSRIFTVAARVEIKMKTQSIAFPAGAVGLDAITDVLIRQFSQNYENVYTFCLFDSSENHENKFSCDWLVVMTEKNGGGLRVGCGSYNWSFDHQQEILADHLIITIEQMILLSPDFYDQIFAWVIKLPYPRCSAVEMLETMPSLALLNSVRNQISNKK